MTDLTSLGGKVFGSLNSSDFVSRVIHAAPIPANDETPFPSATTAVDD
jgi:hypothetical protein